MVHPRAGSSCAHSARRQCLKPGFDHARNCRSCRPVRSRLRTAEDQHRRRQHSRRRTWHDRHPRQSPDPRHWLGAKGRRRTPHDGDHMVRSGVAHQSDIHHAPHSGTCSGWYHRSRCATHHSHSGFSAICAELLGALGHLSPMPRPPDALPSCRADLHLWR